tara:strand:+ start:4882 stop:5061 length:180 start_codon:yes stop_codon:yes gene_type:complete
MMLYPSAWITFQILNDIPAAFIGRVFALVLTNQILVGGLTIGLMLSRPGLAGQGKTDAP